HLLHRVPLEPSQDRPGQRCATERQAIRQFGAARRAVPQTPSGATDAADCILRSRSGEVMRCGQNPMYRPVDRIEVWATAATTAALMLAGPVMGGTVGWRTYRHGVAVERVEHSQRFRTQAVLLHD